MSSSLPIQRDVELLDAGPFGPRGPATPAGELRAAMRRHRVLIAVCVALGVAVAVAYTILTAPVYQANAVLRFEQDEVNLPQLVQTPATENRISTEMEVVQDRSAATAVVDSLGLRTTLIVPRAAHISTLFSLLRVAAQADSSTLALRVLKDGRMYVSSTAVPGTVFAARITDTVVVAGVTLALSARGRRVSDVRLHVMTEPEAVRAFQASLTVSRPARDADLIDLQIHGSDPYRIAAAANLLAQQLISERQEVQIARTGSTVDFLRQQLDTLGGQLRRAEDQLSAYRERAGVVDAPTAARTQVSRLVQVQADRGALEAERDALAMLVAQMHNDSARSGGGDGTAASLMSFPTLFKNQATGQLLASLASVENERAALLVRRKPADPDVMVLTARIHDIHSQLQSIAETYLQGLTNQIAGLDAVAGRFGTALDSLPKQEVQTARLERGVTVLQDLYTLIQTRLKEAEITQSMKDPALRIVDPAVVPDKASRPRPLLNLALGSILGLVLGLSVALWRELTNRSVRSRADALYTAGIPVLGAIPKIEDHFRFKSPRIPPDRRLRNSMPATMSTEAGRSDAVSRPESRENAARIASLLVTRAEASPAYAEAFSQLHMNLSLAHREQSLKCLVFTSPLPGEGKTLSAINFALTVAARGLRVLLIDADLRRGLVNEVFRLPRSPGFAELLRGTVRFEDATRRVMFGEANSLAIIPSGARLPAPGRLQTTARISEVLDSLRPQFDVIVIDSPPINLLADAALLGSAADGVLLVVRAGRTSSEALRFAMEQLTAARAPVVGTLLNDIDVRRNADDDGSYRYLAEVERYYAADV